MPGDGVNIPRLTDFSELERLLKPRGIVWRKRKGKGGHGSFVGPDRTGRIQAFPLPSSQHRQVIKPYVAALLRRFGLTPDDLFAGK